MGKRFCLLFSSVGWVDRTIPNIAEQMLTARTGQSIMSSAKSILSSPAIPFVKSVKRNSADSASGSSCPDASDTSFTFRPTDSARGRNRHAVTMPNSKSRTVVRSHLAALLNGTLSFAADVSTKAQIPNPVRVVKRITLCYSNPTITESQSVRSVAWLRHLWPSKAFASLTSPR